MDNVYFSISKDQRKNHTRCWRWEVTYREETGGVDGEKRDLINFGTKECKLWVRGRQREAAVTRRKLEGLVLVVEEWILGTESNAKSETIRSLNLGVSTRLVHLVGVGGSKSSNYKQCQHHWHQPQCHFQCHCWRVVDDDDDDDDDDGRYQSLFVYVKFECTGYKGWWVIFLYSIKL